MLVQAHSLGSGPSVAHREAPPHPNVRALEGDARAPMRLLRRLVLAYLGIAVAMRILEAAGLRRCGCAPDCWCKRPVLSTFRWVFPYGHRGMHPSEKEAMDRP